MADNTRAVFSALDNAKTQLYHFKAIIIAGMGFFTDAYDLFCISAVTKLIGRLYYYDPSNHDLGKPPSPGALPTHVNNAITGVALCGTLAGQLFFGWLGDKLGRKKVYGKAGAIIGAFIVQNYTQKTQGIRSQKGNHSTFCGESAWLLLHFLGSRNKRPLT